MKKEIWWCMKSGSLLLPFTARASKRDAIKDRVDHWKEYRVAHHLGKDGLPFHESCIKIQVQEIPRAKIKEAKKKGGRG